jgi:hypothetical protein
VHVPTRLSLLNYDHSVRPERRQRYPRVAVNHFEVERLAPGEIFTVKE